MSTPSEIYWALNKRRDPKMIAAIYEARAAGVRSDDNWEEIIRHISIDAAEEIGCRPQDIDVTRTYHLDVLAAAMTALVREQIDASSATVKSSQSSYLKKA